jgi:hypothetical protein
MAAPFVIMGVLAVILYAGILLTHVSARRDRGQPWATHYSRHRSQSGPPLTPAAPMASVTAELPLDPDAAVREAIEIVTAAHRTDG